MQSGPGVFKGDLHFYMSRRRHPRPLDADRHQALPAVSADRRVRLFLHQPKARSTVAERTGAPADDHEGLGHFPMSEDPEKFIGYLLPVLEKIRAL